MPEALAVVFVFFVAAGIFLFSLVTAARAEATEDTSLSLQQLKQQEAWLEERLQKARQEKWDGDMVARLLDQQKTAAFRLRRLELKIAEKAQLLGSEEALKGTGN